MKKIIAINAGPRKGWNTEQLIKSVAKGAEAYKTLTSEEREIVSVLEKLSKKLKGVE